MTEVGISHPAANLISQELQKAFLGNSERHVEFYTESLDTMTFSDEDALIDFRDALIHKYRNIKIDVIVAMGREAIQFLAQPVRFAGGTQNARH